jgi:hypothetical protein
MDGGPILFPNIEQSTAHGDRTLATPTRQDDRHAHSNMPDREKRALRSQRFLNATLLSDKGVKMGL